MVTNSSKKSDDENSMFRIALCDNDEQFLKKEYEIIQEYFSSSGEEYSVDLYCSGAELIKNTNKLANYNLILLDCQMPEMSGLEVAEYIRNININVPIAFSTDYYDFTIKGYHYGLVRYLVKTETAFRDNIIECIKYVKSIKNENEYLSIKVDGVIQKYRQSDIVWITSEKHYLVFYIRNGTDDSWSCSEIKARIRFEDISESLSSSFLRVHQRNIINMDYIDEFTAYFIVIYIGHRTKKNVSMTVRNKKELQKKYYSYKGSLL